MLFPIKSFQSVFLLVFLISSFLSPFNYSAAKNSGQDNFLLSDEKCSEVISPSREYSPEPSQPSADTLTQTIELNAQITFPSSQPPSNNDVKTIEIHWYPKWRGGASGFKSLFSHFTVLIPEDQNNPNGNISNIRRWRTSYGFKREEDLDLISANKLPGHLKFVIRLNSTELENLTHFLNENSTKDDWTRLISNGVTGLNKLLATNSLLKIPFPLSKQSLATVLYLLYQAKGRNNNRIESVKWVPAQNSTQILKKLFSPQFFYESYSLSNFLIKGGLLFVSGIDYLGSWFQHIISIMLR